MRHIHLMFEYYLFMLGLGMGFKSVFLVGLCISVEYMLPILMYLTYVQLCELYRNA